MELGTMWKIADRVSMEFGKELASGTELSQTRVFDVNEREIGFGKKLERI